MLTPSVDSANTFATATSSTLTSKLQAGGQDDAKLRDACRQFESYMVGQMFHNMRESLPKDGLFPQSQSQKIFQEMLDGEYAKRMSETDSIGLSTMLYQQLHAKLSASVATENHATGLENHA